MPRKRIHSNSFGSSEIVPMKFFMEQSLPWIEKDIREDRRVIDAGMPAGRVLIGTAVMPRGIPGENLRTMLEAAFKYGGFRV